ncbi:uncharacterized protein [Physcomitrium patens]|uniref:Uncharacterized protein n=2 Tax=Physcomitrium patens TaxID=3218 RepID=A0A7I3ZCK6_PHYPA|nr:uncharacterized protein LOC112290783 [Physcomitrium patens]|eukprot:XP_024393226.1 uncharacterized protein LOC112290783 [Physcomitrella patens]
MGIAELFNKLSRLCNLDFLPSLDFAGMVVLVGKTASEGALPYTCLVSGRLPYLNAYMTSGSVGLAQAVLTCIDWWPARVLTGHRASGGGSMLELFRLRASGKAAYIGLQSGTSLKVQGSVGEALVSELLRLGRNIPDARDSKYGRNAKRPTFVVRAKIGTPVGREGEVVEVSEDVGALLSIIATIVSLLVVTLNVRCQEWFALSVVVTGMILNALLAYFIRLRKFEFNVGKAAGGSPPGDSLVQLSDAPNDFCVLQGDEDDIQSLLQREVRETGFKSALPLFSVCVAMLVHSAVVVLGTPHMGKTGQLLLLIAVSFGAIIDLLKGSWDANRSIGKWALHKWNIEILDAIQFANRTAAVAYIAAGLPKTEANEWNRPEFVQTKGLQVIGIVPTTGPAWEAWWEGLTIVLQDDRIRSRDGSALKLVQDEHLPSWLEKQSKLWADIREDMFDGILMANINNANVNNVTFKVNQRHY